MKKLTLLTLLAIAAPSCVQAAPLTLTQNGKPNATIVVQADAPKPVQAAAADLQKYIAKISGVELPLKADGQDVPGITLNVGQTAATRESDLPNAKLNPETYAISQRGDDIYFTGRYPSPTAFAVYAFLQDQLGVRWFAPGDDWEYVPPKRSGNLRVDVKNVVRTPDWSPRIWSGHNWTEDWNAWNLRNKTVQSERVPRRQFQNNMYRVFPPTKYAKAHPEYYPLVNGKRWIPANDTDRYWWPCIGNPEVQRMTVDYMRDYFTKNPDADSFSLGMDDIAYLCSCPLCRKLDANPDDYEKRKFSDRFYKFVNLVAKDLKTTHPDKYIGTLIYHIARELPLQVPKLEDNVFGYITQTSANWYNPETKKADQDLTRAWAKRVKHLSRYDYFGFASFTPRVYPHLMDEEMKFDKSLGFDGMYVEMYTFLPHTAPMMWAFAQLQWDTKQNIDPLLNDFYAKMYPSTTKQMKSYFDLLERSWTTSRPGHTAKTGHDWEHRNIVKQAVSISAADTKTGLKLLDEAYTAAATPVEKRRIDVARQGLKYASFAIIGYDLAQQLATLNPQNAGQAQTGIKLARELGKLSTEREKYWAQALNQQNLFGANLRGLKGMILGNGESYLQTNASVLDAPAQSGLSSIIAWYHQNQPAQAAQVTSELLAAFPAGSIADLIRAANWVATSKPTSLVKNGDFENAATNKGPAAQSDWQAEGVPVGWSTWSSLNGGKYGVVAGRNNSKGISVHAPAQDRAVALQNIPVQAGKKYLATVWVKPSRKENAPHTSLSLRLRTSKGWYTGQGATQATNASNGEWQQLMLWVSIPEGVTETALMLGTESDTTAVFDDVAVYEVP